MKQKRSNNQSFTIASLALLVVLSLAFTFSAIHGQENGAGSKQQDLKTHKVERGQFKIDATFSGRFAPEEVSEVKLEPEEWKRFKVNKAVPEGGDVQKGDVLVAFETDELEEKISRTKREIEEIELNLKTAKIELENLDVTVPIKLTRAEFEKNNAEEDLKYFLETGRALQEQQAKERYARAEESLEYQLEELRQLKKMYNEDDITEDTEEIILKRQKNRVEHAKFRVKRAKERKERQLTVKIPRKEKRLKWGAKLQSIQFREEKAELSTRKRKKEIQVENLKSKLERTREELSELQNDRKLTTIKADRAGVVYYGQFERGNWKPLRESDRKALNNNGHVNPGSFVLTVGSEQNLIVHATVPEKELHVVQPGVKSEVKPTGFPSRTLEGSIRNLDLMPDRRGNFQAVVQLDSSGKDGFGRIRPGMTCKVNAIAYEAKNAITIPKEFVHGASNGKPFVRVQTDGGSIEKKTVVVGKTSQSRVEIKAGLSPGETVVVKK